MCGLLLIMSSLYGQCTHILMAASSSITHHVTKVQIISNWFIKHVNKFLKNDKWVLKHSSFTLHVLIFGFFFNQKENKLLCGVGIKRKHFILYCCILLGFVQWDVLRKLKINRPALSGAGLSILQISGLLSEIWICDTAHGPSSWSLCHYAT